MVLCRRAGGRVFAKKLAGFWVAGQLVIAAPALATPPDSCLRAAQMAERRWALPPHLLLAVGRVETGRLDPATGVSEPWPWSANAGGAGYVFSSAAEAGFVVGRLQAHGIESIDVGCFQVNLHYHPDAFATVEQGFDPDANADYAGRFLRELHDRTGSWEAAIGGYHSADPLLADPYRLKVLQALRGFQLGQGAAATPLPRGADPHVILAAAAASRIPVYTPQTLPSSLRAALKLGRTDQTAER